MASSRTTIQGYTLLLIRKKHQGIWNYISMQLILGVIKNERTNRHLWLRDIRLVFNTSLLAIYSASAQVDVQLEKSSTNYLNVVASWCVKQWVHCFTHQAYGGFFWLCFLSSLFSSAISR